jgi:PKD repeat protein
VTFTLGSSGSPTGWTLDYGDGSAASGSGAPPATLTHTYTSADQPTFDSSSNVTGFTPYVATLTTWNNCGYSAPATTQVTVSGISTWFTITWTWPLGTAPCTPSTCTLTAGTSLNFQDFAYLTSTGSAASSCSWSWVFGGSTGSNNTSTLQSPSYTYATSGTYTPTLSVTCAGSTATSSQTIAVAGCVVPSLVGNSVATADSIWTEAGFQTTPQVVGNTNQGAYTWVTSQNVASGTTDPTCSTNIHLTVGPTPTPTP